MREHPAGSSDDFDSGTRRFVTLAGEEVGVIEHGGSFYAFANVCPHQGGPVCEGVLVGGVEVEIDELGRAGRTTFSETDIRIACPWHGVEFDLRTGRCVSEPRMGLRRYEVVERDGQVYVIA